MPTWTVDMYDILVAVTATTMKRWPKNQDLIHLRQIAQQAMQGGSGNGVDRIYQSLSREIREAIIIETVDASNHAIGKEPPRGDQYQALGHRLALLNNERARLGK